MFHRSLRSLLQSLTRLSLSVSPGQLKLGRNGKNVLGESALQLFADRNLSIHKADRPSVSPADSELLLATSSFTFPIS